jgi:hypothetical protein
MVILHSSGVIVKTGEFRERLLWEDEYEEYNHPFQVVFVADDPTGFMIEWGTTEPGNKDAVEQEIIHHFIDEVLI